MTYIVMLSSMALMFICGWLHFDFGARAFAFIFLMTLLEIVITDAVAAGIKKAKQ
jgi:hypothetical protein